MTSSRLTRWLLPYRGAGILFCQRTPTGWQILLGQRLRSGVWSISGGASDAADTDSWATALRETHEEFGLVPPGANRLFVMVFPLGLFRWRTYVLELTEQPEEHRFPDRQAHDFRHEFRDARWFDARALPAKTHWLIHPATWWLRLRSGRCSRP